MKALSPELAAHLVSGTTTLCWCWRVARRDGVVMGFTDHDKALTFGGTTYEAASGFTASDIKDSLGLAVDNLEVTGALSSTTLTDGDLAAGRYDDARIEIYRVNWSDTSQRVLMRAGTLGEVTRGGGAFQAEIRGLAQALNQPVGRAYGHGCDADLGDARCTVSLAATAGSSAAPAGVAGRPLPADARGRPPSSSRRRRALPWRPPLTPPSSRGPERRGRRCARRAARLPRRSD